MSVSACSDFPFSRRCELLSVWVGPTVGLCAKDEGTTMQAEKITRRAQVRTLAADATGRWGRRIKVAPHTRCNLRRAPGSRSKILGGLYHPDFPKQVRGGAFFTALTRG